MRSRVDLDDAWAVSSGRCCRPWGTVTAHRLWQGGAEAGAGAGTEIHYTFRHAALFEQLAELVADDQQAGQRPERYPGGPGPLVVALVVVLRLAQQLLPPDQLALDRAEHAVDQRQLVLEVGDDGAGGGPGGEPMANESGNRG